MALLSLGQVLVGYQSVLTPEEKLLILYTWVIAAALLLHGVTKTMQPAAHCLGKNHLKTSNMLLREKKARGCIWKVERDVSEKWLIGEDSLSSPACGCKCSMLGWCSAVPMWPRFLYLIYPGEISWEIASGVQLTFIAPRFSAGLTKVQGSP